MKKTAILIACLAATAFAGEELVPATTETVIAPAAPTDFALEATAGYNFASRDIFKDTKKLSTISADLTGVWALGANDAVTLRFGYGYGDNTDNWGDGEKAKFHLHSFYLMPGYRYTTPVADGLNAFAGVNLGVINHSVKYHDIPWGDKLHDSAWGFAYSAELGVTYDLSSSTYLLAAYQFAGSTATPKFGDESARKQYYHGLRLGVGCKF